jgi:ABC-2 type transport system permease protein
MRRFLCILRMDLGNLFKNPVLVGYNTVFAVIFILIMGYLCGGNYEKMSDAYQYYGISFLIFGMLEGAMTASNCFMERDIKRPNLRIIYSPAGPTAVWLSKLTASFLFDYLLHLLLLAVLCPVLHITIGRNPVYFIVLMAPVEFASAALGIFFCCVFHCEETTSTLLSTVISVFGFLGGTFFPTDGLGTTVAALSRLSPVRWLNDAFFSLACDNNLTYVLPVFVAGIIISALLMGGCRLLFKTEDYL